MHTPSVSFPNPDLLTAVEEAAQERQLSRSEFIRSVLAEAIGFVDEHIPYRSKLQVPPNPR